MIKRIIHPRHYLILSAPNHSVFQLSSGVQLILINSGGEPFYVCMCAKKLRKIAYHNII